MATTIEWKQNIAAGQYDAAFCKLYADRDEAVKAQRARYIHAIERLNTILVREGRSGYTPRPAAPRLAVTIRITITVL